MSVFQWLVSSVLSLEWSTLLVFIVVLYFSYEYIQQRKLPPGPPILPLIGSLPFIDTKLAFWKDSRRLGVLYNSDVIAVRAFGRTTVILLSYDAVREAFQKRDDMAARPKENFFRTMDPLHEGILMSSGPLWKEHRRFTLFMLKDVGMGKFAAEHSIQDEAAELCEFMVKRGTFDPINVLEPAVSNIVCAMAFGRRFDYDDADFLNSLKALNFIIANFRGLYLRLAISPLFSRWLSFILPTLHNKMRGQHGIFKHFVKKIIDDHREKFDGSVNDLIDGFFAEAEKRKQDENNTFTDAQLQYLIEDLFLAGSETTTTTLRWALLYLIKYPDIQEKIHQELDQVIGPDRPPQMNDRKRTPYTEAFLLEVQRLNTIVPLAVGHSNQEDVEFRGYHIPKDSVILSNLAAYHRDPKLFPDPDTFKVERFLNEGQVVDAEKIYQFGIGKRVCAGEALARMEIYIFFTTLVQKLKFSSIVDDLSLEGGDGPINGPRLYQIRAIARQ